MLPVRFVDNQCIKWVELFVCFVKHEMKGWWEGIEEVRIKIELGEANKKGSSAT